LNSAKSADVDVHPASVTPRRERRAGGCHRLEDDWECWPVSELCTEWGGTGQRMRWMEPSYKRTPMRAAG